MDTFKNGKPHPPDEICNPNWDKLLKVFHSINNNDKNAKKAYNDLKELAFTKTLTERQLDGIIGRCNHQINEINNPTPVNRKRVEGLEQFQKMRSGKFSSNGNG
jgi:hypothetical protein